MRIETDEEIWQRWRNEFHKKRPPQARPIHAIADITFLRTEEGGRTGPVIDGYRGQFHYEGNDSHLGAEYTFASNDPVQPGESTEALIWLLTPEAHTGHLYPGRDFEIREGRQVVARGRITWVSFESEKDSRL